ncbi:hypothetical protein HFRIS_015811 [Herbaspirillum frisingense GSF30]|uniref:Uncharacterized protein n=1 Tax=Herbaspirillum frisingense GSF30 TaxID=864073 RepID=A0AAI9IDM2_9BURK|nr:hypothetical protein HFRIS_015811 [Herbaspirillum frisingense GSF30]
MGNAWCYLEYRYGDSSVAPTRDEIMVAVKELYEENLPDMTEDDYDEHGDASLRYGYDDGPGQCTFLKLLVRELHAGPSGPMRIFKKSYARLE